MLVIPDKQLLVINTPLSADIITIIPHAKQFMHKGKQLTAVAHGVEESQVLKNMGFDVPHPIQHYYDWPGRLIPMAHQKETAAFMVSNRRALCLSAPGTGKSLAVLWAADYMLNLGLIKKVLIIAPLSILKPVWGTEFMHHFPHRAFNIILGARAKRESLIAETGVEFSVINHDGFSTMPWLFKDYDLLIYDEATALKSPSAQRYKKFMKFMTEFNPRLWMLTGTPISQNPTDAWTLAKLAGSKTVPRSFTQFKDITMQRVTQFRWIPRAGALDVCKAVLQPSIRFSLDECVDLPQTVYLEHKCELTAQQSKAFTAMRNEACLAGANISAANAAVLFQKLLQICCISEGTEVLTLRGWVPIESISAVDHVWDGLAWVTCSGAVYKGYKQVVRCWGVCMTPDHEVLTNAGWRTAGDINGESPTRYSRADFWLPHSDKKSWLDKAQVRNLVMPLRVRERSYSDKSKYTALRQANELLRVQASRSLSAGARKHSRYASTEAPTVLPMDRYAQSLRKYCQQGFSSLRSAGHYCMQSVGRFLGIRTRYGRYVPARAYARSQEQLWELHTQKLPLGYSYGASKQHKEQHTHTDCLGETNYRAGGTESRAKTRHRVQMNARGVGERGLAKAHTYDVANAGPRNRFMVRNDSGYEFVVHNCGVVYDSDGARVYFDDSNRLETLCEVLDEIGDKAIVYVPLRGVQDRLEKVLVGRGMDVATVHGGVSKKNRDLIFDTFQNSDKIQVLLAHPRVAAHGLNLTRASNVIWYAPIHSLEQYEQANARIRRLTTEGKTAVHHICATSFEHNLYQRLKTKQRVLSDFLALVRGVNE